MRRGWTLTCLGLGLAACAGLTACSRMAPEGATQPTAAVPATTSASAAAPVASAEPAAGEPAAAKSGAILMAVRAVTMNADRRARRPLEIDDRLQSGDFFAYHVRVDRDAYVYVLQFYADGSAAVLFPAEGAVRVSADTEQRLPADERGWFRLDDATGTEHLYVIAAVAPLEQADPALAELIGRVRTSPRAVLAADSTVLAADSTAEATAPEPEPAAKALVPQELPRPIAKRVARLSDPLLRHARERAAVVVRVEEDGLIEYQGRARDGVGVVHFPFRHE